MFATSERRRVTCVPSFDLAWSRVSRLSNGAAMPASQNTATTPSKRTELGAIDCAQRGQSFAVAFAVFGAGLARRRCAVVAEFVSPIPRGPPIRSSIYYHQILSGSSYSTSTLPFYLIPSPPCPQFTCLLTIILSLATCASRISVLQIHTILAQLIFYSVS